MTLMIADYKYKSGRELHSLAINVLAINVPQSGAAVYTYDEDRNKKWRQAKR
ncbi:hypothetical protein [Sinanaerobacter sp. ZZT-01]|uniref:hypothetical protein n=1 Tax=Sinanaerobacter sp. ZZT-01 TaxID=3111540 RepID=UPI002D7716C8|nr:hypothetical protein [Sinanaerobacter sp. ZZT-01]WRR92401.1 hypothetical protein U5921_10045 [Sinanaerobacter sp. ZZT-01]